MEKEIPSLLHCTRGIDNLKKCACYNLKNVPSDAKISMGITKPSKSACLALVLQHVECFFTSTIRHLSSMCKTSQSEQLGNWIMGKTLFKYSGSSFEIEIHFLV